MSVRTGDRQEGKLQVLNQARILKEYSLDRLRRDKVFPKSTRWLYAYPIAEEVRGAVRQIRYANSVYVLVYEEYVIRRTSQTKAYAHLEALYDLIDDAYLAGYVDDKTVSYWVGLIVKTQELIKAWMKSDKERYKEIVDKHE